MAYMRSLLLLFSIENMCLEIVAPANILNPKTKPFYSFVNISSAMAW